MKGSYSNIRLRRIAFVGVIFVLPCIHFLRSSLESHDSITINDGNSTTDDHKHKLADGCYHVFLDVGSNIGMHVRFLLEPHKYPQAKIARNFFEYHFGPEESRDNRDFCIFSWEPNPSHIKRHEEMRKVYSEIGWRYFPIHGGVGDSSSNITFYHIGDDTGFTMLKSSCRKECTPEHVPVYRLSDWMNQELHGREIPSSLSIYEKGPRVVMKMDIEMMEWLVLPDLISTGTLCPDVNGMVIEFHLQQHWFFYPITFVHTRLGDNYTINKWEDADKLKLEYLSELANNANCSVEIRLHDDESHRGDGMPWPTPNETAQFVGIAG